MNLITLLVVVLLLLVIGGAPIFSYSASWGYGPSGVLGLVLVVVLILWLLGKL